MARAFFVGAQHCCALCPHDCNPVVFEMSDRVNLAEMGPALLDRYEEKVAG
jgi:hypothetical protein